MFMRYPKTGTPREGIAKASRGYRDGHAREQIILLLIDWNLFVADLKFVRSCIHANWSTALLVSRYLDSEFCDH